MYLSDKGALEDIILLVQRSAVLFFFCWKFEAFFIFWYLTTLERIAVWAAQTKLL